MESVRHGRVDQVKDLDLCSEIFCTDSETVIIKTTRKLSFKHHNQLTFDFRFSHTLSLACTRDFPQS